MFASDVAVGQGVEGIAGGRFGGCGVDVTQPAPREVRRDDTRVLVELPALGQLASRWLTSRFRLIPCSAASVASRRLSGR